MQQAGRIPALDGGCNALIPGVAGIEIVLGVRLVDIHGVEDAGNQAVAGVSVDEESEHILMRLKELQVGLFRPQVSPFNRAGGEPVQIRPDFFLGPAASSGGNHADGLGRAIAKGGDLRQPLQNLEDEVRAGFRHGIAEQAGDIPKVDPLPFLRSFDGLAQAAQAIQWAFDEIVSCQGHPSV